MQNRNKVDSVAEGCVDRSEYPSSQTESDGDPEESRGHQNADPQKNPGHGAPLALDGFVHGSSRESL